MLTYILRLLYYRILYRIRMYIGLVLYLIVHTIMIIVLKTITLVTIL